MNALDRDPRLPMDWRYGPFSVCFVDRGQLMNYTSVEMWIKYPDFIAVIHELTIEVIHKLPDLPITLDDGEGLSLRDGPWYYRIVHPGPPQSWAFDPNSGWTPFCGEPQRGPWRTLRDFDTYQRMRGEFMEARMPVNSWVEVRHHLQKLRDMKNRPKTPYVRPAPVIVDGSKPPEQNLYDQDFLPQPRSQMSEHMETQIDNQGLVGRSASASMPQPTFTDAANNDLNSGILSKAPKAGLFYPPKPRHNERRSTFSTDDVYGYPTKKHDSYKGRGMRDNEGRNMSFVTNPYADDLPVNDLDPFLDGPGPAVPTSPTQLSPLDLGSPAMALSEVVKPSSMKPAEFHYNFQTLRLPTMWPPGLNNSMISGNPFDQTNRSSHLDPALDSNQKGNLNTGHRNVSSFASSKKGAARPRPADIVIVNPNSEMRANQHDTSEPVEPAAAEEAPTTPRTTRRNTIQKIQRKAAQRASKLAQQAEIDKEREKLKEIIDKQRDERMKRAEKRRSMSG